jgi:hypothetical protein
MTGKRYYLTTLGDWQRHAARFSNSHYIALDAPPAGALDPIDSQMETTLGDGGAASSAPTNPPPLALGDATLILALVEADEGAHLALEDDAAFEPLPHPLAQKPISDRARAALAPLGVAPGSSTFDAAEILARFHPLLRHRVF